MMGWNLVQWGCPAGYSSFSSAQELLFLVKAKNITYGIAHTIRGLAGDRKLWKTV